MTKNLEIIYVAQPSSEEIQSLYDGIATHAQSRNENGIAQRLSPNDKHLSPL